MDNCNCNKKISVACNECNPCNKNCCSTAKFGCDFDIAADPFDPRYWFITMGVGCSKKIRLPDLAEKSTFLDIDCSSKTLTYYGENETQTFAGEQLGCLLNLDDLRDVNAEDPAACSMLVYNPGCGRCPCTPEEMTWQAYTIPDAEDCEMEPDDDGYYKVLVKNDCGCIEECRLPVVPSGMTSINYVRDSVPDDPDFPWYYGCYNDTINLYLAQNAPQYFGKYPLEVTVNYGIQTILSDQCKNANFRSLVVPVVDGDAAINVEKEASILQGFVGYSVVPEIPWGSQSMRGSFTFIVPKGKEAALHHEFRLRTQSSFPNYYLNSTYDGVRVPDAIASQVNAIPWNASRLNALQVIVRPTFGTANMDPVVDDEKQKLEDPIDEYPTL